MVKFSPSVMPNIPAKPGAATNSNTATTQLEIIPIRRVVFKVSRKAVLSSSPKNIPTIGTEAIANPIISEPKKLCACDLTFKTATAPTPTQTASIRFKTTAFTTSHIRLIAVGAPVITISISSCPIAFGLVRRSVLVFFTKCVQHTRTATQ